eukprot:3121886-Rhodomonas_salina.3
MMCTVDISRESKSRPSRQSAVERRAPQPEPEVTQQPKKIIMMIANACESSTPGLGNKYKKPHS